MVCGSGKIEVQHDDPLEGLAHTGGHGSVLRMRSVGRKAFAGVEVHAEAVRQVLTAFGSREILAPMRIHQTRDLAHQSFDEALDRRDLVWGGFGTRSQKQDVSDHDGQGI